nr:hypothetical protein [Nitrosomonas nitrosa]
MSENLEKKEEKAKNDQEISIVVKGPEPDWETTFPKTAKIEDVIKAYVTKFGLSAKGKYELRLESDPNTALKSERTLVSYHIKDGDVLVFVDFGEAV